MIELLECPACGCLRESLHEIGVDVAVCFWCACVYACSLDTTSSEEVP